MDSIPVWKADDVAKYEKLRWWMGLTLGDVLDRVADVFPGREGVVDDRSRLTYGEIREGANRLALSFLDLGIGKGDCVLLQLPNWAEYVYAFFGLQKIGAVPVLCISGFGLLETSHMCNLTQAKAWIVPAAYRKTDYTTSFIGDVLKQNPCLKHVISVRSAGGSPFTATLEALLQRSVTPADLEKLAACRPDPKDVAHVDTVRRHHRHAEGHPPHAQRLHLQCRI